MSRPLLRRVYWGGVAVTYVGGAAYRISDNKQKADPQLTKEERDELVRQEALKDIVPLFVVSLGWPLVWPVSLLIGIMRT